MTRVVTGAALVGLVQGVVLTLLLSLGAGPTGWYAYTPLVDDLHPDRSAWVLVIVTPLVAGLAGALAQRRGWLGPRPERGHALAGRLGVTGVLLAAAVQAVAPPVPPDRPYADYVESGATQTTSSWVVFGAAVAAGVVLVLLAALREGRTWARPALAAVLLLALAGVVTQLVLLDGLTLAALAGEVLALLLGGAALALARR